MTDRSTIRFVSQPDPLPEYSKLRRWGMFDGLVFGPVKSRRFGRSLGVNPLPRNQKVCSFDCPYCECGRTVMTMEAMTALDYPRLDVIADSLRDALARLTGDPPDTITFTGNGEPTMHPDFPALVELVISCRDEFFPEAKLAALTNGTFIGRTGVADALERLDIVMLKLDAGTDATLGRIDIPLVTWSIDRIEKAASRLKRVAIQSMFLRGAIDNTGSNDVDGWLAAIARIKPSQVFIYTLDRVPPSPGLQMVPDDVMESIGMRVARTGVPWHRL